MMIRLPVCIQAEVQTASTDCLLQSNSLDSARTESYDSPSLSLT